MHIHLVSIFPEIFESFLGTSLIKKAQEKWVLAFSCYNPREFSTDPHQQIDDSVYWGWDGMLIKAQPIIDTVEFVIKDNQMKKSDFSILFPTPTEQLFNQKIAHGLSKKEHLIFICWRYEWIDYRAEQYFWDHYPDAFRKYSIGPFITLWGEGPSLLMIEAITRLIPGVIKEKGSWIHESYSPRDNMSNIEAPNYTRPIEVYGMKVPEVLLNGDEEEIAQWREEHSINL